VKEFVFVLLMQVCPPNTTTQCFWTELPNIKNPFETRAECNKTRNIWRARFQGLVQFHCERKEKGKNDPYP